MLKILHTGDLHIGREYSKQEQENPQIAKRYRQARLDALVYAVRLANERNCDYFVVAGDLYDKKAISVKLQEMVCGILGECACPVLVIPGNHDYYEGDEDHLWNTFRSHARENTVLLTEQQPYVKESGKAVFYPCICKDRYSKDNALSWLKRCQERDSAKWNIGIAHGALEGLSYDQEKKYYYMTKEQLNRCDMDLWLLGHTHVPEPKGQKIRDQRIFNAGTHQQTDFADNAPGSVFLIEAIDKNQIIAEQIFTSVIHFAKKEIVLLHGESLEEKLAAVTASYDKENTSLRVTISGIALAEEYQRKHEIYERARVDFLKLEIEDGKLRQEITMDVINAETVEGSLENRLLRRYLDDPELLHLAFALVQDCREDR